MIDSEGGLYDSEGGIGDSESDSLGDSERLKR
jgi:hypothetical protein